jgi:hypothetical protein
MALNKDDLKSKIASLLRSMMEKETDSFDEFAQTLSDAIDSYVKDAEIVYTSGLTAPNGPVSGIFKGGLK